MGKISNKQYDEFWSDDSIVSNNIKPKEKNTDNNLKKEVKKEVKKEIKKIEEQVKNIIDNTVNQNNDNNLIEKHKNKKEKKQYIIDDISINKNDKKNEKNDLSIYDNSINIYKKYESDNIPYKIYFRGVLIYDSSNRHNKPEFFDNYFILYGKQYLYRGIRFEKY